MSEDVMLPPHGRINCRNCFTTDGEMEEIGPWRAVNDPGAWGASAPIVLVLGFSKGSTQADAYRKGHFEDIPFKDMRVRLTTALRRIGVLSSSDSVDVKFSEAEPNFAFGSLVRCSLSRLDAKSGRRECTGAVMPKAFTEHVKNLVRTCAQTYLSRLPNRARLVVMLGSGDPYIQGCKDLIRSLYGAEFKEINSVAYRTPGVIWVHIAHPSGLNGHFNPWIDGNPDNASGRKLLMALDALKDFKLTG